VRLPTRPRISPRLFLAQVRATIGARCLRAPPKKLSNHCIQCKHSLIRCSARECHSKFTYHASIFSYLTAFAAHPHQSKPCNEADFVNVKSTLELACDARGISVLFLPKFHCELNFIEQCWGHAKRLYCQKPPSSSEEDLEKNLVDALDSVTVEQMRKYARRFRRFMNAYQKGLTGKQAIWATKKYRGHRVIPDSILAELEEAEI